MVINLWLTHYWALWFLRIDEGGTWTVNHWIQISELSMEIWNIFRGKCFKLCDFTSECVVPTFPTANTEELFDYPWIKSLNSDKKKKLVGLTRIFAAIIADNRPTGQRQKAAKSSGWAAPPPPNIPTVQVKDLPPKTNSLGVSHFTVSTSPGATGNWVEKSAIPGYSDFSYLQHPANIVQCLIFSYYKKKTPS